MIRWFSNKKAFTTEIVKAFFVLMENQFRTNIWLIDPC